MLLCRICVHVLNGGITNFYNPRKREHSERFLPKKRGVPIDPQGFMLRGRLVCSGPDGGTGTHGLKIRSRKRGVDLLWAPNRGRHAMVVVELVTTQF
jgi:hypothetical protein